MRSSVRGRRAAAAWVLCALPVAFGFLLPVAWLLRMLWLEAAGAEFGLPLARFADWALASLRLAATAAVAATLLALALGVALRRGPDGTGTVFGLLYAYLARFSAVALQSVESGLARVPRSIDDTARLLGASPRRVFLQLHLPLLRRSALAAALLVFVDVMKELPATLVLRPFGSDTLAVVAYNLARDERLGEAALPSLAIVAVGLLPVVLLSRALRQT